MTLYGEFLGENHRRIHKWYQYFPAYETHFERFRNRHVTIFEIGVGEGGSLQQWRGYLGPFATIVGLDIYPRCKQLEDDQIHIRIGSQTDLAFLAGVVAEFGAPDIVIDDGSHLQPHVNATFDFLYPQVAKNGVYLVEDLHAAYWADHGGGLRAPASFIETAKSYVDRMHVDYAGDETLRSPAGDRTTSIHFYDSVVVFEVGERRVAGNRTTGNPALFDNQWAPPGENRQDFATYVDDYLHDMEKPGHLKPQPPPTATAAPLPRSAPPGFPKDAFDTRPSELDIMRASTSWRLTRPLRAIGRLFRR